MKRVLISLLPLLLLAGGCVIIGDEIETTDEAIGTDSGSSSEETSLIDPGLAWSTSSCEATLKGTNSFPTLSNEYGVSVTYASSDESVATISSSGAVTLVAEGTTVITASCEEDDTYDEDSTYYTLKVVKSESGLAWSTESASIVLGAEYSLPTLSNGNNLSVTFASSNESVATVGSDGTVTPIADGTTVISAIFAGDDNFEAATVSYTLTVTKSTDGISWSAGTCTVTLGAGDNCFPTLNNPGSQTVAYTSSNESVATIDADGTVTLIAAGATTITATSGENENYAATTVSYTLTVNEEGSNLKSADLSWPATSYSATMGETFTAPTLSNPHSLSVTYISSNGEVATIASDGAVTLVGAGTTTITATSAATSTYAAGSAYYTLTVSLSDAGIAWSASYCAATFGESNEFPEFTNGNDLAVTFESSDTAVATVDSDGNPTLVASGTAYISAFFAGDETYAASTVTYTLKVNKGNPTLTWSASTYTVALEDGSWDFPTCTTSPNGLTLTYASSKTTVATVDASTGVPAPVATGSTTITATSEVTDQYKSASATYTLTVTSTADDGAGSYTFDSAGDKSSDDDISNTTFTRKVTVTYASGGATVSGYNGAADYFDVTTSGNSVTITYTGSENVVYELTGTASDGFFKLYSTKKQALWLNGLSLTCSSGAAINNQSGKRTFVYVNGTNTLADGASAAYSTTGDEDMKGVFFSEGQLVFSGPSSGTNMLTVTANNAQSKSGIVSDDYVRMLGGVTVNVTAGSSAGHGVRGKEYVQISDGTLNVTTKAAMKKGIGSDDYVLVEGGTTTVNVSGGVAYDSDDAEYTGTAGVKADNYFAMTGGVLTITNTGSGGKGIRAGSYDYAAGSLSDSYISGGTLTITTSGSESNDVSSKAIKIGYKEKVNNSYKYGGNLLVSGGETTVNCSKSEAVEVKGALTISGGSLYASSTGDDAINSQGELNITGGYVYGYSTQNDAIDTNCDLKISGGYVFAMTTKGTPEVALDANTESGYKLYIYSGATVVAYGGLESSYSASQSVYSMSCSAGNWNALHNGGSYIAAFKAPSGCSSIAVSAPSLSKGYTGVSVGGSTCCNGIWATSDISGGTAVTLSSYSGNQPGGGGGTPPGPGR
ncbi:MAG: carbohydrate-binding domain-containing protein [Bacteroidales bacterium]|nr:carbohydrate-binding domain-containing protein [Bacteroidales bacterium]